jgi:hypothetical protein
VSILHLHCLFVVVKIQKRHAAIRRTSGTGLWTSSITYGHVLCDIRPSAARELVLSDPAALVAIDHHVRPDRRSSRAFLIIRLTDQSIEANCREVREYFQRTHGFHTSDSSPARPNGVTTNPGPPTIAKTDKTRTLIGLRCELVLLSKKYRVLAWQSDGITGMHSTENVEHKVAQVFVPEIPLNARYIEF